MKLEEIVARLDETIDAIGTGDLATAAKIAQALRKKIDSERHVRDAFSILIYGARKEWASALYRHISMKQQTEDEATVWYQKATQAGYTGTAEEWRRLIEVPFRSA